MSEAATTETEAKTETPAPRPPPKRTVSNTAEHLQAHMTKAHEEAAKTEPKVEEPKKPEPKPEEKKEAKREPAAPQLKAVMERERIALEREQRANEALARTEAFEKAKASGDIAGAFKLLGYSNQQVQDYLANGQKPTPEIETKALGERVEAELKPIKEHLRRQEEEKAAAAMAQAETNYKAELTKIAKAGGEKFEFCASEKFGQEAMDTAVEVLKQEIARRRAAVGGRGLAESEIPTQEEVLQQVEAFYEGQYAPERLLTIGKLKAKLSPVAPQSAYPPATSKSGPKQPKTLTNAAVAAPPPRSFSKRPTVAERTQRLEALLRSGGNSGG